MTARKSQATEMMLFPHAMHQPITDLGSDVIPVCHAVTTPYKRACRSSEQQGGGERV